MVYFQGLCKSQRIVIAILLIYMANNIFETECTKIAYKKSLNGKLNPFPKDKHWLRSKVDPLKTRRKTVRATALEDNNNNTLSTDITSTPSLDQQEIKAVDLRNQSHSNNNDLELTTINNIEGSAAELPIDLFSLTTKNLTIAANTDEIQQIVSNDLTATTNTNKTLIETNNNNNNATIPCTCGIFLSSQIPNKTGNSSEQPIGKAVIVNELDRIFACNNIGQKQCQTKCLEAIVQHLPNSANILCATLDRDVRKERAYLFIKNCRNQWWNTNLAAGREYCCKNGQPYQCPLV